MAAFIPGIGLSELLVLGLFAPVIATGYPLLMLIVPGLSPARLFR